MITRTCYPDDNSAIQTQNKRYLNITIHSVHCARAVKRFRCYFIIGGHPAALTELKIMYAYRKRSTVLERSVMN